MEVKVKVNGRDVAVHRTTLELTRRHAEPLEHRASQVRWSTHAAVVVLRRQGERYVALYEPSIPHAGESARRFETENLDEACVVVAAWTGDLARKRPPRDFVPEPPRLPRDALRAVRAATSEKAAAVEAWEQAVVAAHQAGLGLASVARAASCSVEEIRELLATRQR